MAKQSKQQKDAMGRVMHEFKHGELKMRGDARSRIRARRSRSACMKPAHRATRPRRKMRATCAAPSARSGAARPRAETEGRRNDPASRGGRDARTALYAEAKRRNIPGRSKMSRQQLVRALQH